jgi:arginase family enzyme
MTTAQRPPVVLDVGIVVVVVVVVVPVDDDCHLQHSHPAVGTTAAGGVVTRTMMMMMMMIVRVIGRDIVQVRSDHVRIDVYQSALFYVYFIYW